MPRDAASRTVPPWRPWNRLASRPRPALAAVARRNTLLLFALMVGVACNDDEDDARVMSPHTAPPVDPDTYVTACDTISMTRVACGLIPEAEYGQDVKACVVSFAATPVTPCDHARVPRVQCQARMSCDELAAFPADPGSCAAELEEEIETCEAE